MLMQRLCNQERRNGRVDDASSGDERARRRAGSDGDRGRRTAHVGAHVWSGDGRRHRVNRWHHDDRVRARGRRGSQQGVGAARAPTRDVRASSSMGRRQRVESRPAAMLGTVALDSVRSRSPAGGDVAADRADRVRHATSKSRGRGAADRGVDGRFGVRLVRGDPDRTTRRPERPERPERSRTTRTTRTIRR